MPTHVVLEPHRPQAQLRPQRLEDGGGHGVVADHAQEHAAVDLRRCRGQKNVGMSGIKGDVGGYFYSTGWMDTPDLEHALAPALARVPAEEQLAAVVVLWLDAAYRCERS